jgi:hypothetical protein
LERQNHTISPSAAMRLVVPTSPASIASRLAFVTTRTPLLPRWDDASNPDFGKNEIEIFLRAGLDDPNHLIGQAKLDFRRTRFSTDS